MRTKVTLVLLALAVGASACGGTQDPTALSAPSTTPTTSTTTGRLPRTDPNKSCSAQGIDRQQLQEGACTEGRVHYVVANHATLLELDSLNVVVNGISAAPAMGSPERPVRPRRGAFLRVTVTVENRTRKPQRYTTGQTVIGIGPNNYPERRDVVRPGVHAEALAAINGGMIPPGETLHGDVIFDVLPEDVDEVTRIGRLFITNFSGTPKAGADRQLGQIRLYA